MGAQRGSNSRAELQGDYALSLRDLFLAMRRRIWLIALVAVVLACATVGFSFLRTPLYEASIKILVGQERGLTQNPADVGGLQQLTKTISQGINSRPIAEAVIQQLDLQITPEEFLEKHLSVEQVPETQFIQVNYIDSSPERAQKVVNTIGDVYAEQLSQVSPTASSITATVWERAVTPNRPASPNPVRDGLLALVLGLMLGAGLALLLEYLGDSWRSPEEAEQISGVPTFGVIPEFKALTGEKGEK